MIETEVKLAASSQDLPRAKQALLAMAEPGAAPVRTRLISVYYDTEDGLLRQHGLVLRVRREGRRFVQTLKSEPGLVDGAFSRGEWEGALQGEEPDLAMPELREQLPKGLREPEDGIALKPVFSTQVQRTRITVAPDESTKIECALDRGEIQASGRTAPLSEVELELKSGDPAKLYDLASRLVEAVPLRLETRTKSQRGFALMDGSAQGPRAVHAGDVEITADMTVEAVLQRLGRECLSQAMQNLPAAAAALPEGVHQMRVGLRRLRSVLVALKRMLPEEQYRRVSGELKWLANSLGPARDWDVFVSGILEPVQGTMLGQPERQALVAAAEQERKKAYAATIGTLDSPRFTIGIIQIARWFEGCSWRDQPLSEDSALLFREIGAVAPRLIERRYKAARRRSRRLGAQSPTERHELRIALKKLRYTSEFLAPLFPGEHAKQFLQRLKRLQDDIGHVHDVYVAGEMVARLRPQATPEGRPQQMAEGVPVPAMDRAAGIVLGWHDRGLADLEPKLRRHVRKFRRAETFW